MKESSFIKQVNWVKGMLYIRLKNGCFYEYEDVPKTLYKDFIKAESLGKFFITYIKGKYTENKFKEVLYTTLPVTPFDTLNSMEFHKDDIGMSAEEEDEWLYQINNPDNDGLDGATT